MGYAWSSPWTQTSNSYWNTYVPQFGGWDSFMPSYGWSWGGVGTSSSGSSGSSENTVEAREKAQKQHVAKKYALIMKKAEFDDMLAAAEKEKQDQIEANYGKGCNIVELKDGSKQVEENLKEMTGIKKVLRAAGNLFKGIGNIGKSLAGYEADGKWNPWKLVRNVAVAVAVAAVCVASFGAGAAVIGAGLVASRAIGAAAGAVQGAIAGYSVAGAIDGKSKIWGAIGGAAVGAVAGGVAGAAPTIAAIPATLGYTGVATGAAMASKGLHNAINADTVEEFDKAWQDVGAGGFIGLASAAGLRNLSKTAGVASTAESSFGRGLADTFVNPYKATTANLNRAAEISSLAGGGWRGFKASFNDARLANARYKQNEFQKAYDAKMAELDSRITRLESDITAASGSEKAMLEIEHEALLRDYVELGSAKNKFDFKALGTDSKDYLRGLTDKASGSGFSIKDIKNIFNAKKEIEINGYVFKGSELKTLQARISDLTKNGTDLSNISKLRFNAASSYAGRSAKYMDGFSRTVAGSLKEADRLAFVKDFGYTDKFFNIGNFWNTQRANMNMTAMGVNGVFTVADPAYSIAAMTKGNSCVTPMYIAQSVNPIHEKEAPQIISANDWDKSIGQYNSNIDYIKQQRDEIKHQLDNIG